MGGFPCIANNKAAGGIASELCVQNVSIKVKFWLPAPI
jgi:hypothetical protein